MLQWLWIFILMVAVVPFLSIKTKSYFILGLVFISYAFISISYVSWLSWISELIPEKMRGRFFGTRNMFNGVAGIAVMVILGKLLDYMTKGVRGGTILGFGVVFSFAVLMGIISLRFLSRISECPVKQTSATNPLWWDLSLPFKNPNFRRFLTFAILWNFSVNFASPFFTLYFLRDLRFSYGFIALLGMISGFADLLGMQIWGRISDKVKNKAVIYFGGWIVLFLPMSWVFVGPGSILLPILLHVLGGSFWSGINLCMNNLLLGISPEENKAFYLSAFNITSGLGAALGPIMSGAILKSVAHANLRFFSFTLLPLHLIFLMSTAMRLLSLQFFRLVHEPEAKSVAHMIRIIRNIRGLNVATGFNSLLHPFIILEE